MSELKRMRRRTFLGAAGVVALTGCKGRASSPAPATSVPTLEKGEVPLAGSLAQRGLGKTGVNVSALGLGGYHLGLAPSEAEAHRLVHAAIDRGVTFMDNSWDYHQGRSETWMGNALADGHRQQVFLMTKLDGRTKKAVDEQLEQSLRRLRTDVIDLVQIHEVIRDSDARRCFEEGAVEALIDAQQAGKLKYIGFTGHKDPNIHLAMLAAADRHGFHFDTVQLPLNVLDAHYRSFEKLVLPVLLERQIGVLGMKPLASGKIPETGQLGAVDCLRYAASLPASVVITGCEDLGRLDQALRALLEEPMTDAQKAALLDRSRELANGGRLERFKTTQEHESTAFHPEWMG